MVSTASGEQLLEDIPSHAGQPKMTALMLAGQSLATQTEAMENGGLDVAHMHGPRATRNVPASALFRYTKLRAVEGR